MTIQELGQLKYLKKEIEWYEKEERQLQMALRKMERQQFSSVTGSRSYPPYTARSFLVAGVVVHPADRQDYFEKRRQLKELRELIVEKSNRCIQEYARLIRYIHGIPDSLTRQVFTLRYLKGMSWEQVAQGVGGENTVGSVKMVHKRYLEG